MKPDMKQTIKENGNRKHRVAQFVNSLFCGQESGSVGKVLAVQAWMSAFKSQNPFNKGQVWWSLLVITVLGRQRLVDSWDPVVRQPSLMSR